MSPSPNRATNPPVALLIGAAGHHGRGIATALADAGWAVAGLDLVAPATALAIEGDATDRAVLERAINQTEDGFGPIDLLVLAADHDEPLAFADVSHAAWTDMLNLHLRVAVNASRALLPGMIARERGSIVAITPASSLNGTGAPHRAAAASSVIGFVKALAREVGPSGVLVNAVAPGPPAASAEAISSPLGRAVTPAELGETVRYLATERNYFAGQVLSPSGGSHL